MFLSRYLILFPLSILALARALKRSPWLALAGFALAFNQNWIYGFSSYLMGTCFMFFSLALLIRWLDGGDRWRALVVLGVSTVLAYFGHVMPWFCFGLCAIALLLQSARSGGAGCGPRWRCCRRCGFAVAAVDRGAKRRIPISRTARGSARSPGRGTTFPHGRRISRAA